MQQHYLLRYSALAACVPLAIGLRGEKKGSVEKPDIIYIYTDLQSSAMMSCAGNKC